jgi:uncharacterized membrane protein YedE/YeeE
LICKRVFRFLYLSALSLKHRDLRNKGVGMYIYALVGGMIIGLASWMLLTALGRVAGISGIASGALVAQTRQPWRVAFLAGLIVGGAAAAYFLNIPMPASPQPTSVVIAAGLLVGFGTVLGSGCTSGHGICGLARGSKRSFLAVCVFMLAGVLTVTLRRLLEV